MWQKQAEKEDVVKARMSTEAEQECFTAVKGLDALSNDHCDSVNNVTQGNPDRVLQRGEVLRGDHADRECLSGNSQ